MNTEQRQSEQSNSLPPGFHWEYREGEDGGGTFGQSRSEHWPSTVYRRAVGPWVVWSLGHRERAAVIKSSRS